MRMQISTVPVHGSFASHTHTHVKSSASKNSCLMFFFLLSMGPTDCQSYYITQLTKRMASHIFSIIRSNNSVPTFQHLLFGKNRKKRNNTRFLFYLWVAPHPTRCKIRIKVICTTRNMIWTYRLITIRMCLSTM